MEVALSINEAEEVVKTKPPGPVMVSHIVAVDDEDVVVRGIAGKVVAMSGWKHQQKNMLCQVQCCWVLTLVVSTLCPVGPVRYVTEH